MKTLAIILFNILFLAKIVIAETEPNNGCGEANSISIGSSISGKFDTNNDKDYYSVVITTPGAYIINVINTDPNTRIACAFTKDCVNQFFSYDGVVGQSYSKSILVEEAGTYYIFLRNGKNIISNIEYTLSIDVDNSDAYEYNNNLLSAKLIPLETPINAAIWGFDLGGNSLTNYKDVDFYKFKIPQTGILGISVKGINSNTLIQLSLYNEAGENFVNDFCDTLGESIELFQLPLCDSGYYYLKVLDGSFNNKSDVGPYTLYLHFLENDCNNSIETATKVEFGQVIKGEIRNDDSDYYQFETVSPVLFNAKIEETENPFSDKVFTMYDSDGKIVWEDEYYKDFGLNPYKDHTLCQPGKYTVKVSEKYHTACISKKSYFHYNISFIKEKLDAYECNNDLASATPINLNNEITASVDYYEDKDFYTFPALFKDSILIDFEVVDTQFLKVQLMNGLNNQILFSKTLKNSLGDKYKMFYYPVWNSGQYILSVSSINPSLPIKGEYIFNVHTASKATSTNEIVDSQFTISPNPANQELIINNIGKQLSSINIDVTDILGKILLSKRLPDNYIIDVSTLYPGTYFITIISNGNKVTKVFQKL